MKENRELKDRMLRELEARLVAKGYTPEQARMATCIDAYPGNADWPKRTRDFWIDVTEPEELADLVARECETPEALDRFMSLPGVRMASDAHLLREAAGLLREQKGWK